MFHAAQGMLTRNTYIAIRPNVIKKPIIIKQNTSLKAAIFIEKDGQSRKFVRTRNFYRLRPAPTIVSQRAINDGKLNVSFAKSGNTGTVYYTTDNSNPDRNAFSESTPLAIAQKATIKAITIWEDKGEEFKSEVSVLEIDVPKLTESVQADVNPGILFEYYEGVWKKLPDFNKEEILKSTLTGVVCCLSRAFDPPVALPPLTVYDLCHEGCTRGQHVVGGKASVCHKPIPAQNISKQICDEL